jgi:molecular chaperone GrpE
MRGKGSKRNWSGRGDSHLSEKNKKNKGEDKSSKEGVIEVKIEEGEQEESRPERVEEPTPAEGKGDLTLLKKLQVQLEEKTKEAEEKTDQWLRLRAELENFKKRVQKEKSDLIKFGNESLLKAMLPTLDNLARAVDHGRSAKENSSLLEGVEITQKQFFSILEKFGVKPIQAVGAIFDPEKHEAISQQESDQEPSRVIAEVEKGYFFHDRLLRPAKVIVSKAKAE